MDALIEVLNSWISKYQIADEDIAELQEILTELETGENAEFEYPEDNGTDDGTDDLIEEGPDAENAE